MNKTLTPEKILISLIILLSFFLITFNRIDPDLGWHLISGKWIWENGQIQHFDTFSHTMGEHEWVNHEWLVDIGLWLLEYNDMWWLATLIFTIIAACALIYYIQKSKSLLEIWIFIFLAVAIAPYIGIRPQIISFFLFFILHRLLLRYFNHRQPKITRVLIPTLFLIWANLHAGFASGLALFVLMAVGYYIDHRKTKNKIPVSATIAIFVISAIITLINPYFYQLHLEIYHVFTSAETARYISEWKPALNNPGITTPILLALCIFTIYKYFKKIPLLYSIPVIFFSISYLKSTRLILMLVIVLIPYLLECIKIYTNNHIKIEQKWPTPENKQKIIKTAGSILFIPLLAGLIYTSTQSKLIRYPYQAISFLREYKITHSIDNLYNYYTWGGYLIHELPDTKIFIDGRMPHWQEAGGNSAMKDYIASLQSNTNPDWYQTFEKHDINTVLIPNPDNQIVYQEYLKQKINHPGIYSFVEKYIVTKPNNLKYNLIEKNWQILYEDDIASVLVKD